MAEEPIRTRVEHGTGAGTEVRTLAYVSVLTLLLAVIAVVAWASAGAAGDAPYRYSVLGQNYVPARNIAPDHVQAAVEILDNRGWGWRLSRTQVPAGVPVSFSAAPRVAEHGYAIYDAGDRLVARMEPAPGSTHTAVYVLDTPGTYTVKCLRRCRSGRGESSLVVTATR